MSGPLNGLLVLDLTRVLAGPFCTLLLGDLGAEIIKIERPEVGDDARHIGPFIEGRSAYFASVNRGKKSLALNLKAPEDRAIFEGLLERADVLVENYRPGTMEKLGYGWERLHQRWPRLIYAACSGFGHTGPRSKQAAYDMVVQAMGGLMSVTGHPGGPPTRVGTSIGDLAAGLFTAVGVNAALFDRERTGAGRFVDVAMLDCQVALLENAIARWFATGQAPQPLGARHPSITPFAAFAAQDGHLVIAAGNDELFKRLCGALGREALLTDARFKSNGQRSAHAVELQGEIEATLQSRPVAEWLEALTAAGVPCGPLNTVPKALADPQVQARRMVVSAPGEGGSTPMQMAGNPIKMSGMADSTERGAVPGLDEHRAEVLARLEATQEPSN